MRVINAHAISDNNWTIAAIMLAAGLCVVFVCTGSMVVCETAWFNVIDCSYDATDTFLGTPLYLTTIYFLCFWSVLVAIYIQERFNYKEFSTSKDWETAIETYFLHRYPHKANDCNIAFSYKQYVYNEWMNYPPKDRWRKYFYEKYQGILYVWIGIACIVFLCVSIQSYKLQRAFIAVATSHTEEVSLNPFIVDMKATALMKDINKHAPKRTCFIMGMDKLVTYDYLLYQEKRQKEETKYKGIIIDAPDETTKE